MSWSRSYGERVVLDVPDDRSMLSIEEAEALIWSLQCSRRDALDARRARVADGALGGFS